MRKLFNSKDPYNYDEYVHDGGWWPPHDWVYSDSVLEPQSRTFGDSGVTSKPKIAREYFEATGEAVLRGVRINKMIDEVIDRVVNEVVDEVMDNVVNKLVNRIIHILDFR